MNIKILEYAIYILLGALVLWIILKVAGVINTPVYVEIIPEALTSGLIALIFQYLREDIKEIRTDIKEIRDELSSLKKI